MSLELIKKKSIRNLRVSALIFNEMQKIITTNDNLPKEFYLIYLVRIEINYNISKCNIFYTFKYDLKNQRNMLISEQGKFNKILNNSGIKKEVSTKLSHLKKMPKFYFQYTKSIEKMFDLKESFNE